MAYISNFFKLYVSPPLVFPHFLDRFHSHGEGGTPLLLSPTMSKHEISDHQIFCMGLQKLPVFSLNPQFPSWSIITSLGPISVYIIKVLGVVFVVVLLCFALLHASITLFIYSLNCISHFVTPCPVLETSFWSSSQPTWLFIILNTLVSSTNFVSSLLTPVSRSFLNKFRGTISSNAQILQELYCVLPSFHCENCLFIPTLCFLFFNQLLILKRICPFTL